MKRAGLAALLVCALASPGSASPQSEALSARGLIALDGGDTRGALAYFERAVAADPQDAQARYQQAVARAKLGDSAGAIADFQAALALRPHFPAAALELGIALVDSGRFQEAEPWLTQAQSDPDLDAQASFFLGIAQLRLERYDEARQSFARARARDASLLPATQFYDGVIAYRQGDTGAAQTAFEAVLSTSPTSAMGRESTQYLALITQRRRAMYSAFGTVALEYDSNVTLGPDSTVPGGISGKGDWRFVVDVGGRYVPFRRGGFSLALSYEFFQTVQFHLGDFNLQDHRPAVQLQYDFDRVSLGLLSRYDYYLLGSDSYLQEVTAFPWTSVREDDFGRTDLFFRMQWRDYWGDFNQLNGYYYTVGFRQFVDLGSAARQLWFGYEFEPTDVTGRKPVTLGEPPDDQTKQLNAFEYTGQVAEVGLRWPLAFDFKGQAGYRFEYQKYASGSRIYGPPDPAEQMAFPLQGGRRVDHDHRVVISLERPLPELYENLSLVASWFGTWNDSNKTVFQYTRQIGSIGLQVRF